MGVEGICLLCSSQNGFRVGILGPFPTSLQSKMGQCDFRSSDSKCWLLFIFSKVLRIPDVKCGELLSEFSLQNTFRICGSCAQLVSLDAFYRQQILTFQSHVDALEKRVQKSTAQCPDVIDGSSQIDDRGVVYETEDVIAEAQKGFDSSLPRAEAEMVDELVENNSEETMSSSASNDANGGIQEGDCRIATNDSSAPSSSQAYVEETGNAGQPSNETCCDIMPVKLENTPDDASIISGLTAEGWSRENHSSQPPPQHSSSGIQQGIQEAQLPHIQRNEYPPDALLNPPVHPPKSISSSNRNTNLTKRNIIRKNLALRNETLRKYVHHCRMCPKTFSGSAKLRNHIRTHTGVKPFKCQLCNKGFAQYTQLSIHMRVHTKERPFKCATCHKTFTTDSNLKTHVRVHTKEKAYNCIMCQKNFSHYHVLEGHFRVHTNEKPYFCNYCGNEYSWRNSFKRHLSVCLKELKN